MFFFVKIFKKRKYAEAMLDGGLHVNRLSYFRKVEEEDEENRGDKHEAVVGWHHPDKSSLAINGVVINPSDLVGPISIQMNWHGNLNVYCIYAAHSGNFESLSQAQLPEFQRQLEIPDDCLKLGKYAVVVKNAKEFINRVVGSSKQSGYGLKAGLVKYYDPETFSGFIDEEMAAFHKRNEYTHQKEYRFAVDTGTTGDGAIKLEIGSIRDIAHFCDVSEVNAGLEIKLPG